MSSALAACTSKWHRESSARGRQFPCEPRLRICGECFSRASRQLTEIPALYRELGQDLSVRGRTIPFLKPNRTGNGTGGVANEMLIDIRANITEVIASWANLVAEERKLSATAHDSLSLDNLSVFLRRHLQWLAAHPAAPDFVHEMDTIYSEGLSQRFPGIHDLESYACGMPCCGARLRIVVHPERIRAPLELRCDEGHSWKPGQWLELKNKKQRREESSSERLPRRVPTKVAAAAAGVSEATIRQWVRRGKLTRYGTDTKAEFDLHELAALSRQA